MKDCNNGINFIILATVISIVIAKMLDDAQQNVFGNFLQAIGSNISTIAAFDEYVQTKSESKIDAANDDNIKIVKTTTCDTSNKDDTKN